MMPAIDARACLGTHDVLFATLDTLRFDVAAAALARGMTPNLARLLPGGAWECRHTPASFTFAAHQAFFAGFLPTPVCPREDNAEAHERLFAARFAGSETTSDRSIVFDTADIVSGFSSAGYRTICIGGTGFFNRQTALGSVLPDYFDEDWWSPDFGVTARDSAANQIAQALSSLAGVPMDQPRFLFINFSACHPPHHFFASETATDGFESQCAALASIDCELPALFEALTSRRPLLAVLCSDHGTAFGEDGFHGHRIGHRHVWDVPYMQALFARGSETRA
jgi:hypothetical protein